MKKGDLDPFLESQQGITAMTVTQNAGRAEALEILSRIQKKKRKGTTKGDSKEHCPIYSHDSISDGPDPLQPRLGATGAAGGWWPVRWAACLQLSCRKGS